MNAAADRESRDHTAEISAAQRMDRRTRKPPSGEQEGLGESRNSSSVAHLLTSALPSYIDTDGFEVRHLAVNTAAVTRFVSL